ncbi:5807_t:CDS:1, partial [Racocetra persica]
MALGLSPVSLVVTELSSAQLTEVQEGNTNFAELAAIHNFGRNRDIADKIGKQMDQYSGSSKPIKRISYREFISFWYNSEFTRDYLAKAQKTQEKLAQGIKGLSRSAAQEEKEISS